MKRTFYRLQSSFLLAFLAASFILHGNVSALVETQTFLPFVSETNYISYFPIIANFTTDSFQTSGFPRPSNSYYVSALGSFDKLNTAMYNQGCWTGRIDANASTVNSNLVILSFGAPIYIENVGYGTKLYGYVPATTGQIATAAEQFARGYYECVSPDRVSRLTLGIGTTSYETSSGAGYYSIISPGHGKAWANMVNDVNTWLVSNGYSGQVTAVGAIDIETSWAAVSKVKSWVDGYDSADKYMLLNFGAAEGCAYKRTQTYTTCNGTWTQDDVYYVSYGVAPAYPVPEIYLTNGYNAVQWALISLRGYKTQGRAMEFMGVMTEYQACQQRGGCASIGIDNTPEAGWTQLSNELNADSRTAQYVKWSTDILWMYDLLNPSSAASLADGATAAEPNSLFATDPQLLISNYKTSLASQSLDNRTRTLLEGKLALQEQLAADIQAGINSPAPDEIKGPDLTLYDGVATPLPEGIFEDDNGQFKPWQAVIDNVWQGAVGEGFQQVFAGVLGGDDQQGIVWVYEMNANRFGGAWHYYQTTSKLGSVRIQSVENGILILKCEDGTTFSYNPALKSFSIEMNEGGS